MDDPTVFHRLSWQDFDAFARIEVDAGMMRRLRRAERSRRKLLLRAVMEESAKTPELCGPLPSVDTAWELLARVEDYSPRAFEQFLAHPYLGSWAGYVTRLLRNRIDGVCPLWMHLGHVHALAAAAAIRAGLDFETEIPVWEGNAMLPSLGMARLITATPFDVAVVRGDRGDYTVANQNGVVGLPGSFDSDADGWWGVRRARARVGSRRFSLQLDDLDPYRGLYEPVLPQRLSLAEIHDWQRLIVEACQLIVDHVPALAETMPIGLSSVVPKPQVLFQNPSASTGEAFGSAVIGKPGDGASLAVTLIHEFQHIVLGGVLHLSDLVGRDPCERIYVAWRDDPRPASGAFQGVYAFLGVTMFWRALASADNANRRAAFEFAYWRQQTWSTLQVLRADEALTDSGRRFTTRMAGLLETWQDDSVPGEVGELAAAAAADHQAGWRVRHLRPDPEAVAKLVNAWNAGHSRPPVLTHVTTEIPPTPIPDGAWTQVRIELVRMRLSARGQDRLPAEWSTVPGATVADFAYASSQFATAATHYRAQLAVDPDRPTALIGLGLALSTYGPEPAARALLRCPELVRAVHRGLRSTARHVPTPEQVASWIGCLVAD
jgi:HEXXH motif-containing protein